MPDTVATPNTKPAPNGDSFCCPGCDDYPEDGHPESDEDWWDLGFWNAEWPDDPYNPDEMYLERI